MALDLRNSMNLNCDIKLCNSIICHCMELKHLVTLNILVNKCLLKDLSCSLHQNKTIKKFSFENETRDNNRLLVEILKSIPNLRCLELATLYDDILLAQLPLMTKLRHLKLTDYHQGLLKTIKCAETLESISVKYCKSHKIYYFYCNKSNFLFELRLYS